MLETREKYYFPGLQAMNKKSLRIVTLLLVVCFIIVIHGCSNENNADNISVTSSEKASLAHISSLVTEGKWYVGEGDNLVCYFKIADFKRDEAGKIIESLGGEVLSSVTKSTTLVVAGESAGSKLDKATKLGIKIISEEQFKMLIKT